MSLSVQSITAKPYNCKRSNDSNISFGMSKTGRNIVYGLCETIIAGGVISKIAHKLGCESQFGLNYSWGNIIMGIGALIVGGYLLWDNNRR